MFPGVCLPPDVQVIETIAQHLDLHPPIHPLKHISRMFPGVCLPPDGSLGHRRRRFFFWKETVLYISNGPERFAGAASLISFRENGPGSSVRVTDGVGSGDIQVVIPWDIQSVREKM